jgi:hypothetical protein
MIIGNNYITSIFSKCTTYIKFLLNYIVIANTNYQISGTVQKFQHTLVNSKLNSSFDNEDIKEGLKGIETYPLHPSKFQD